MRAIAEGRPAGGGRPRPARRRALPRVGPAGRRLLQEGHPPHLAPPGRGVRARGLLGRAAALGPEPRVRAAAPRRPGDADPLPADLAEPLRASLDLLHALRLRPRPPVRDRVPRAGAALGAARGRGPGRRLGVGAVRPVPVARGPLAPLRERRVDPRGLPRRRAGGREAARPRRPAPRPRDRAAGPRRIGGRLRDDAGGARGVGRPRPRRREAVAGRRAPGGRRDPGPRGGRRPLVRALARGPRPRVPLVPARARRCREDVLVGPPGRTPRDAGRRHSRPPASLPGLAHGTLREPRAIPRLAVPRPAGRRAGGGGPRRARGAAAPGARGHRAGGRRSRPRPARALLRHRDDRPAAAAGAALPRQGDGHPGFRLGRAGRLRRGRVAATHARPPVVARGRPPPRRARAPGRRRRPLPAGGAAAVASAARRGHADPGGGAAAGARARAGGDPRGARSRAGGVAGTLRRACAGPRRAGGGRGRRRPRPRAPPAEPGGVEDALPAPARGPRGAGRPGLGPCLLVRLHRDGACREVARPHGRAPAGAHPGRVAARRRERARAADEPRAADARALGRATGVRHRLPRPAGRAARRPDAARAPRGGSAGRRAARTADRSGHARDRAAPGGRRIAEAGRRGPVVLPRPGDRRGRTRAAPPRVRGGGRARRRRDTRPHGAHRPRLRPAAGDRAARGAAGGGARRASVARLASSASRPTASSSRRSCPRTATSCSWTGTTPAGGRAWTVGRPRFSGRTWLSGRSPSRRDATRSRWSIVRRPPSRASSCPGSRSPPSSSPLPRLSCVADATLPPPPRSKEAGGEETNGGSGGARRGAPPRALRRGSPAPSRPSRRRPRRRSWRERPLRERSLPRRERGPWWRSPCHPRR